MPAPASTWRLFVGAYPPPAAADSMLEALRGLGLSAHYRASPPEQVHLTLQFIGDTAVREVAAVTESVERSASGLSAFGLTPRRLMTLPERGHARLVALETDAPGPLLELVRRLATRLAKNPRAKPADRFLPHLTLCRFDHTAKQPRFERDVDLPAFTIDSVKLMRSVLTPQGARHTEVATFPLEPPE